PHILCTRPLHILTSLQPPRPTPFPYTTLFRSTASANLTITVPAYASLGYHYVNLQAVNGSIVRTATVYVYVYPAPTPDFSISIVPSSETLIAGTTGNYSVILTSQNGFSGTVGLNATSTNGFTTVFNPQ